MEPDKTPGPDGFSIHFYKLCWELIKPDLLRMIHEFLRKENIGGGINVVSNYLILSFKHAFSISISSTDTSSASPVALLMREILEGGTLPRPKYELDFPLILLFFERSLSKINFLEILSNKSFFNVNDSSYEEDCS